MRDERWGLGTCSNYSISALTCGKVVGIISPEATTCNARKKDSMATFFMYIYTSTGARMLMQIIYVPKKSLTL
jgi:hypothetical protein